MDYKKAQLVERISTGERARYVRCIHNFVCVSMSDIYSNKGVSWPTDDIRAVNLEPDWLPANERLPESSGYVWVILKGNSVPYIADYLLSENSWKETRLQGYIEPENILAWKPVANPSPYVPPKPEFNCGKCAHHSVCIYLDRNKDCGGEYYEPKHGSTDDNRGV